MDFFGSVVTYTHRPHPGAVGGYLIGPREAEATGMLLPISTGEFRAFHGIGTCALPVGRVRTVKEGLILLAYYRRARIFASWIEESGRLDQLHTGLRKLEEV